MHYSTCTYTCTVMAKQNLNFQALRSQTKKLVQLQKEVDTEFKDWRYCPSVIFHWIESEVKHI